MLHSIERNSENCNKESAVQPENAPVDNYLPALRSVDRKRWLVPVPLRFLPNLTC
jgi:hypothetical protein